jgi:protein involved in polysaccharide export with SLBB domain
LILVSGRLSMGPGSEERALRKTAIAGVLGCALGCALGLVICGPAASQDAPVAVQAPAYQAAPPAKVGVLEGTVGADQYIVGPGDVLEIGFWGEVSRSEQVVVSPDGDALVSPVGPLRVAGLTLAQARQLVREKLAPYYRPSILSVSLIGLRTFQVHVVGSVARPGAIEASAVTRVSQAISLAGGLAEGASERNIRVARGGRRLDVDLTRYLLLGDNQSNPFLGDGDVINVPPRLESVYIYGSVYREGDYEFVEGESLRGLIELAGGLRPEALAGSIELVRFDADKPDESAPVPLPPDSAGYGAVTLMPGDRVFVRAREGWHRDAKAVVRGEVRFPGVYPIEEGVETLTGLVARAGGLTERASLADATVTRTAYSGTVFPVEVGIEASKEIEGAFADRELQLAQTLGRERKGTMSLKFDDIFGDRGERSDLILVDGDIVTVPKASMSVRVSGQVGAPGLVPYKPGEPYSYYIEMAGGFARGADLGGTRVVTAMAGEMVGVGGTEIRPGDMIWVPRKAERGGWTVVKDIIQVLAQVATIYVVADQLSSQ